MHLLDAENPSGTSTELKEQFLLALRKEFPRERTPVILTPLLYAEEFNLTLDQLNPTSISLPRSVVSVLPLVVLLDIMHIFIVFEKNMTFGSLQR